MQRIINDLKYKNLCLNNEISNKNKLLKEFLNNDENYNYVNDNIKTLGKNNKLSTVMLPIPIPIPILIPIPIFCSYRYRLF